MPRCRPTARTRSRPPSSLAASPRARRFCSKPATRPREARDHGQLLTELLSLPRYHLDDVVEQRALGAQAQLARVGHHRLPPVDLLVAALADRHELGVLHYHHDYDLIADRTDLRFKSVWLATRGTL